jgi:hypothetical protein
LLPTLPRQSAAARNSTAAPDDPKLRCCAGSPISGSTYGSFPGGWFGATNLNNLLKDAIIRLAIEVAGLKFGRDVIVDL